MTSEGANSADGVYRTRLTCENCGHSHTISGRETGAHTLACLHCDTDAPGFDRETVRA